MTRIEWLVAFTDKTWELFETTVPDHEMVDREELEQSALTEAQEAFGSRQIALIAVYCEHSDE